MKKRELQKKQFASILKTDSIYSVTNMYCTDYVLVCADCTDAYRHLKNFIFVFVVEYHVMSYITNYHSGLTLN